MTNTTKLLTKEQIKEAFNAASMSEAKKLPTWCMKPSFGMALCDMALRAADPGMVLVPREIYQGALNYIQHCGANQIMRGEPHPQQWLVDGLLAAAPEAKEPNAAPPSEVVTRPCTESSSSATAGVAPETQTERKSCCGKWADPNTICDDCPHWFIPPAPWAKEEEKR